MVQRNLKNIGQKLKRNTVIALNIYEISFNPQIDFFFVIFRTLKEKDAQLKTANLLNSVYAKKLIDENRKTTELVCISCIGFQYNFKNLLFL